MYDHDVHEAPSHDLDSHDAAARPHDAGRRRFLARLAAAGLSAPLLATALAQPHGHGAHDGTAHAPGTGMSGGTASGTAGGTAGGMGSAMGMEPSGVRIGPDLLPAAEVPWPDGRCAFCGMTLATPADGRLPAGFRERSYAQIRLSDGAGGAGDALHFESIACAVNHAYATGVRDGFGATLHVADEGAADTPAHGLLPARQATFLWAEGLRVSMNARLAAYPNDDAARAGLARLEAPGRHRMLDAVSLYELAPWPEMNLIALLAAAAGLFDEAP